MRIFIGLPRDGASNDNGVVEVKITPLESNSVIFIVCYWLYVRNLQTGYAESLTYIFVAACMGLSLFKFVQWAPKDASFLQHNAFWPFKDVQDHPRSMSLVSIESTYMRLPISRSL